MTLPIYAKAELGDWHARAFVRNDSDMFVCMRACLLVCARPNHCACVHACVRERVRTQQICIRARTCAKKINRILNTKKKRKQDNRKKAKGTEKRSERIKGHGTNARRKRRKTSYSPNCRPRGLTSACGGVGSAEIY